MANIENGFVRWPALAALLGTILIGVITAIWVVPNSMIAGMERRLDRIENKLERVSEEIQHIRIK